MSIDAPSHSDGVATPVEDRASTPVFDESSRDKVLYLNRRAEALSRENQLHEAKTALFAAHRLIDAVGDEVERSTLLATTLHNLGCVHQRSGESEKAVTFLEACCRLELSLLRESPVSLVNLAAARQAVGETKRARDAALRARDVAEIEAPHIVPVALLQLARLAAAQAKRPGKEWERTQSARHALDLLHQAAERAAPKTAVGDQVLAELKTTRKELHRAGLLGNSAMAPTGHRSNVPVLPSIHKAERKKPLDAYATAEAKNVQKYGSPKRPAKKTATAAGSSATTPRKGHGNTTVEKLPPIAPRPPPKRSATDQQATSTTAADTNVVVPRPPKGDAKRSGKPRRDPAAAAPPPENVKPVFSPCPSFYGLQALFDVMAGQRRKKRSLALNSVYHCLRDDVPLMPRFALVNVAPRLPGEQNKDRRYQRAKKINPAVAMAVQLLMERNTLPLRRECFRRWVKALPNFRRNKPMRRAAVHLQMQSNESHRRMRWMSWLKFRAERLGERPPKEPTPPPKKEDTPVAPTPDDEVKESALEFLVFKWLGKITSLWVKIDQDRAQYDDATVQDDVDVLLKMETDFASALSTWYEKHRGEPIKDLEKLEAKLEPFLQLLLGSDEDEATVTLITSLFMNVEPIDWLAMCERNDFLQQCAEDGLFRFVDCILELAGENPAPKWSQFVAWALYEKSQRIPLVDLCLTHPKNFPYAKAGAMLDPHWRYFFQDLAATHDSSENGIERRMEVLRHVALAPGIDLDLEAEGDDQCNAVTRACKEGDLELLQMLVDEAGCAVDKRMSDDTTPLVQAVISNNVPIVKYLVLEKKAPIMTLYNGMTPLQIAKKLGQNPEIIDLLEECELDEAGIDDKEVRKSFVDDRRSRPPTGQVQPMSPSDDNEASVGGAVSNASAGIEPLDMDLSPAMASQRVDDDALSFSSVGTEEVEIQMREETLNRLDEDETGLVDVEIVPSDAPRRRAMVVDGEVIVRDREGRDDAVHVSATLTRAGRGYVHVELGGVTLTPALIGGDVPSDDPEPFEVILLDNGNIAFTSTTQSGFLLEGDLMQDVAPLKLVADETATNFSEFKLMSRDKSRQAQSMYDAMKAAAKRDSATAKEKRRKAKLRASRMEVINRFFGEDHEEHKYTLGASDMASHVVTYGMSEAPLCMLDVDEPLAQCLRVVPDDEGLVTIFLSEAEEVLLGLSADEDVAMGMDVAGETRWEVVELASGNVAFENVGKPGFLVEVRLDEEPFILRLVGEEDCSSFCEFVVASKRPKDAALVASSPHRAPGDEDDDDSNADPNDLGLGSPTDLNATALPEGDETEHAAATRIQSIHRRNRAKAQVGRMKEEKAAATKIQALQRRNIARKEVAALRAQRQNAASEDFGEASPEQHAAATRIQAVQRRNHAKREVQLRREAHRNEAATVLQAVERQRQAAAEVELRREAKARGERPPPSIAQREAAATKIQALQRQKQAKQRVATMKQEDAAATKIQSVQRRNQAKQRVGVMKQENEAATKIQSVQRRNQAKQRVADMKEDRAATTIQAVERQRQAVRDAQAREASRNGGNPGDDDAAAAADDGMSPDEAATKIQSVQRRNQAKQRVGVMKQENEAATKIQSVQRRNQAKQRVADMKEARGAGTRGTRGPFCNGRALLLHIAETGSRLLPAVANLRTTPRRDTQEESASASPSPHHAGKHRFWCLDVLMVAARSDGGAPLRFLPMVERASHDARAECAAALMTEDDAAVRLQAVERQRQAVAAVEARKAAL